jgi:hypothetical protein
VDVHHQRAFAFASAGAALGCAHSKGALGDCYLHGIGIAKDEARGLALGRDSEAAGSCFGQYVVGSCYYRGDGGIFQDFAEAVRFYRLAAAQDFAAARNELGWCLPGGYGVAQDRAEAIRMYRLAAAQGYKDGEISLKRAIDDIS